MKKKKRMIISRSFVLLLSKISSKNPQKKVQKTKQNKTRDPQREEGGKKYNQEGGPARKRSFDDNILFPPPV